jgi:hypothetical protein
VQVRAVDDLVTRDFAPALVNNGQSAVAIHGDDLALAILDGLQLDVTNRAVNARFVLRGFFQTRGSADVEGTHRELRSRLADGLRSDDADGFTDVNRTPGREVAPVALDAAPAS